jgi:hypothetical protein
LVLVSNRIASAITILRGGFLFKKSSLNNSTGVNPQGVRTPVEEDPCLSRRHSKAWIHFSTVLKSDTFLDFYPGTLFKSESRLYNDTIIMEAAKENVQKELEKVSADHIADKMRKWNKKLKVEVRDDSTVHATAKTINIDGDDLHELAEIIGDYRSIDFGRSGANFRMIIS